MVSVGCFVTREVTLELLKINFDCNFLCEQREEL